MASWEVMLRMMEMYFGSCMCCETEIVSERQKQKKINQLFSLRVLLQGYWLSLRGRFQKYTEGAKVDFQLISVI